MRRWFLGLRPAGADRVLQVGAGQRVVGVEPVGAAPGDVVGDRLAEEGLGRGGGEERAEGAPFAVADDVEDLGPGADLEADADALGGAAAGRVGGAVQRRRRSAACGRRSRSPRAGRRSRGRRCTRRP